MNTQLSSVVFINGEFKEANEAKISVFDRGFIFGDGIYEVVPVVLKRLVDRADFWQRFENSLNAIELTLPYSKDEFEEILYQIIAKNNLNEGGIYIQVTRGVAARTFEFVKNITPCVFVFCYKDNVLNPELANSGVSVVSVDDIRWKRRDIKSISLLAQCLAKNEAVKKGAYEGVMVENGVVSEGCSSSIFIIKDDILITKPLSNEILPGIRRQNLLKIATNLGLKTEFRNFSIDEIYTADEAFMSAATLILLPIIKADEKLINGGKIGKYTKKLREIYANNLINEANSYI